jgi:hypothetical protein
VRARITATRNTIVGASAGWLEQHRFIVSMAKHAVVAGGSRALPAVLD